MSKHSAYRRHTRNAPKPKGHRDQGLSLEQMLQSLIDKKSIWKSVRGASTIESLEPLLVPNFVANNVPNFWDVEQGGFTFRMFEGSLQRKLKNR